MRKSVFNLSILMLLAHSTTMLCWSQPPSQSEPRLFPIAYGGKDDGLPRRLRAQGTITRVSYAASRCGELVFPATLKVKLDTRVPGYNHPFLYLVVSCLHQPAGAEQFLNKRIEINATKQYGKGQPCFFDIKTSEIDSEGVPFYCAEREELLQAIMREPASAQEQTVEFKGMLEPGVSYRALVTRDRVEEWRTLLPLRLPFHHAARIEWLNLKDYPALNKAGTGSHQKRIVFKVVRRETSKVAGQYRWNTTYYCRITAIE